MAIRPGDLREGDVDPGLEVEDQADQSPEVMVEALEVVDELGCRWDPFSRFSPHW